MKKNNRKKIRTHLRRKSQNKRNLRFRNSKVGKKCPQCGYSMNKTSPPGKDPFSVTIEHIQPMDLVHGGDSNMSNLEIICYSCNNARNKLKQKYELKGDILPDKFWYSSIYHERPRNKINLIKIYPNEWSDLLQLLSIEEQVKQKFQGRIKGIIET